MCFGALGSLNLPFEGDVWLLGDVYVYSGCFLDLTLKCLGSFMTNVYTVFDVEEKALGFGQLH
jgi:hypothetical protein